MLPSHLQTRYKFDLSPRQTEVIELLARGRTNAEIAEHLGISLDGAKYHVREILGKLGVDSREEAAAAWRASRTPSARVRRLSVGLAGMRGSPMAWAGAASVFVAMIALVVVLAMRGGDESPPVIPDASPTSTSEATSEPSPATTNAPMATEVVAGGTCTSANASLRLELVPDGEDVLIQLFADGSDCHILGPGSLSVLPGPPAQGRWDPYANTKREFKVAQELPASEPLVVWRWMNQCAGLGPFGWRVQLAGLETFINVDIRPGCVAPGSPLIVALESEIDGETVPDPACAERAAGWLCEFASRIAGRVLRGELGEIVEIGGETTYTCAEGGMVEGAEYSNLCSGKSAGDVVFGFPITLHGSHGGPRSEDDIVTELQGALDSGDWSYLAAIGCPTAGPDCSTFVVAFNTRGAPEVAYLVFDLVPGGEPVFVGAGLSGDNAADILDGGTTMTRVGEVSFVALQPPP